LSVDRGLALTGAALLGTALDELERTGKRRAVIALCGAAGLASAMVIERP
jgi:acetyl-CoA C-acetyltransferase